MVKSLIIHFIVLKIIKAAQFCFDDSPGLILVTLDVPMTIKGWSLQWRPWPSTGVVSPGQPSTVSALGCSSGGIFRVLVNGQNGIECPFEFTTERHVRCLPGRPICSFPVTAHELHIPKRVSLYVEGVLDCHCVASYTEYEDLVWEDSQANANYSAPINSILLLEYPQIFN